MSEMKINYSDVEQSAAGFEQVGNTLKMVNKALLAAIMLLKTTAFIGMVGGHAVAAYLENIQPKVDQLSDKCIEMAGDLRATMAQKQQEDEGNAPKFN